MLSISQCICRVGAGRRTMTECKTRYNNIRSKGKSYISN